MDRCNECVPVENWSDRRGSDQVPTTFRESDRRGEEEPCRHDPAVARKRSTDYGPEEQSSFGEARRSAQPQRRPLDRAPCSGEDLTPPSSNKTTKKLGYWTLGGFSRAS